MINQGQTFQKGADYGSILDWVKTGLMLDWKCYNDLVGHRGNIKYLIPLCGRLLLHCCSGCVHWNIKTLGIIINQTTSMTDLDNIAV